MMTIYKTADGKLFTFDALFRKTVQERRSGWDAATQGPFETNQFPFFNDWLIEATDAGVVTTLEVED